MTETTTAQKLWIPPLSWHECFMLARMLIGHPHHMLPIFLILKFPLQQPVIRAYCTLWNSTVHSQQKNDMQFTDNESSFLYQACVPQKDLSWHLKITMCLLVKSTSICLLFGDTANPSQNGKLSSGWQSLQLTCQLSPQFFYLTGVEHIDVLQY